MTDLQVLIWLFGIGGILLCALTYIRNERKQMLLFKCLSDVCWLFHYFLLGPSAYTAVGTTLIAIIRSIVFLNKEKKWAQGRHWLWIFLGIYLIVTILTWAGPISLLSTVSGLSATIGFWIGKPAYVRFSVYPQCICMLIYDILNHSVVGIIKDCLNITAAIVGFFMHDFRKKPRQLDTTSGS